MITNSTAVLSCLILAIVTSTSNDPSNRDDCTVFVRNNLSLSVNVWINSNAAGRLAPNSTGRISLERASDRDHVLLTMASLSNGGEVFGASISLETRDEVSEIDCWYGGVRPSYAADRKSANSLGEPHSLTGLFEFVTMSLEEERDARKSPQNTIDGNELGQDASFSRVILGSTHPVRRRITNSIGMTFVEMFPGEFLMGSLPTEDGFTAPERQHVAWITKPFFIGETEVTQAQWEELMSENPSHFHGDELPVESITWDQGIEFSKRLSEKEDRIYRLPTEAEWEYACRAGATSAYSFGRSAYLLHRRVIDYYAWTNSNSQRATHPVGSKRPNAWGLYDMHGNVLEWCNDWWAWRYPRQRVVDPTGPDAGTQKVARGGGWMYDPVLARSAARSAFPRDFAASTTGFRLVLDLDQSH